MREEDRADELCAQAEGGGDHVDCPGDGWLGEAVEGGADALAEGLGVAAAYGFSGDDERKVQCVADGSEDGAYGAMPSNYGVSMAGALIASLPTLLVYILLGRYFVGGLMAGSVKG